MEISNYKKYESVLGEWKIKRKIGEGSYGAVFEVERNDPDLGKVYRSALKVISIPKNQAELDELSDSGADISLTLNRIKERIANEIDIMSKLKGNSNIVSYEDHRIIAHDNDPGYDILIRMELLIPIKDYFAGKTVTSEEVQKLALDMCKALELCHRHNVIHRDIKPANIFVSENGDFKLGDFGIAKEIDNLPTEQTIAGSPPYIAPEVWHSKPYTFTADIYSLGAVLYQLLNNNRNLYCPKYPEFCDSEKKNQAFNIRVNNLQPFPMPDNDEDMNLVAVVQRACEYNPEKRFQSAREMYIELTDGTYVIPTPPPPPPKKNINLMLIAVIAVIAVIVLCAGIFIFSKLSGDSAKLPNSKQVCAECGSDEHLVHPADNLASEPVMEAPSADNASVETENDGIVYEFGGHTYQIFDKDTTWEEANLLCEDLGGYLVSINSSAENDFVKTILHNAAKDVYWTGGFKNNKSGAWEWSDKTTVEYSNWAENEPIDNNYSENYIEIAKTPFDGIEFGKWNDNGNMGSADNRSYGFICEWSPQEEYTEDILMCNLCGSSEHAEHPYSEKKLQLNGTEIVFEANEGIIEIGDVICVPIRKVLEAIGCSVLWDDAEGAVIVERDEKKLIIKENDSFVKEVVNDSQSEIEPEIAPFEYNNAMYIPLTVISSSFDLMLDLTDDALIRAEKMNTSPKACEYCGKTSHLTAEHPHCSVCYSPWHNVHCAICDQKTHNTSQHPKCTVCGGTDHTIHCTICNSHDHNADGHPKCTVCGGTDHTVHCAICNKYTHFTEQHPRCSVCGDINHLIHCDICGSLEHSNAEHPRCSVCGSTSHTVHIYDSEF